MTYNETIQYLYDRLPVFHHVGAAAYKPGLDNTIRLMNALNNPHQRYKTIHVAGTNGKGSVSHFLSAILQSAGYKVGLYTSPHLVDFGERIRVNGAMIDRDFVVDFVERNYATLEDIQPSFFEATMAMAFDYFADQNVDVAVVEVGLGGRLDSTNIISPDLSVITNISFDHVGFLGSSLESIAFEKAGIIKKNTPIVVGEALPETRPVFVRKAEEEGAPLIFAEEKIAVELLEYTEGKMAIRTSDRRTMLSGLAGWYQLKNIATLLTAVDELKKAGYRITEPSIKKGMSEVTTLTGLRGRWEVLQQHPTVVADTGHNVAGIRSVTVQLKSMRYKTLRIIIGMVNDKDISSVLALLPKNAVYYFTQAAIARALPAENLKQLAESYSLNGNTYSSVKQAIEKALSDAEENDFVLIGGSNFVVGEGLNNSEFRIHN